MTTWDAPTIKAIAGTDDLHVSPFRGDGATYATPTWSGRSSLTASCSSAPITEGTPVGTNPLWNNGPDGSRPPAKPTRSPSCPAARH